MNVYEKNNISKDEPEQGDNSVIKDQHPDYIVTGSQLLSNDVTEIPKVIEPLFPRTGLIALAGSSDTGKSSMLRQLAMDVVSQQPTFIGFPIHAKHSSVIYVSTEDDEFAISYLIKKQNHKNLTAENFERLRFIFDTINLTVKLRKALKEHPADMVIVDAFSDVYGGDLNRTNEVRKFLQDYANISREHECLIIFLHHTGKRTDENSPSKHNMLGSQGFEAKMRLVIELRKDNQDHAGLKRHFCIVKGNYLPDEYKSKSFVLAFTENLTFESTGERTEFSDLSSSQPRGRNEAVQIRARELRQAGNTIDQIQAILLSGGQPISRSAIGNWVRGI